MHRFCLELDWHNIFNWFQVKKLSKHTSFSFNCMFYKLKMSWHFSQHKYHQLLKYRKYLKIKFLGPEAIWLHRYCLKSDWHNRFNWCQVKKLSKHTSFSSNCMFYKLKMSWHFGQHKYHQLLNWREGGGDLAIDTHLVAYDVRSKCCRITWWYAIYLAVFSLLALLCEMVWLVDSSGPSAANAAIYSCQRLLWQL